MDANDAPAATRSKNDGRRKPKPHSEARPDSCLDYASGVDAARLQVGVEQAMGYGPIGSTRQQLLLDLARIYEGERVLVDGSAPALWRKCACRADCWAAFPDEWKPRRRAGGYGNGGIIFPWIGKDYDPGGGVAVLGINLRDASGLYVEYQIASWQLEVLGDGGYKVHNSWWAYRSARTAAAALRSLAGANELDIE